MGKNHGWFHWLINVLVAAVKFSVFGSLGLYLTGVAGTMTQLEPLKIWQDQPVIQFSVKWLEIKLNYSQNPALSWWTIVVWLPLTLIGLSVILINGFNLIQMMSDCRYNLTHCFLCQKKLARGPK